MNHDLLLRRIRQHPALWGCWGPAKQAQAERILHRAKKALAPVWAERRAELEHQRGQRWL
jgi:hypothetical protein